MSYGNVIPVSRREKFTDLYPVATLLFAIPTPPSSSVVIMTAAGPLVVFVPQEVMMTAQELLEFYPLRALSLAKVSNSIRMSNWPSLQEKSKVFSAREPTPVSHVNRFFCQLSSDKLLVIGELRSRDADLLLMIQADMTAYRAPGEPPQLGLPDM